MQGSADPSLEKSIWRGKVEEEDRLEEWRTEKKEEEKEAEEEEKEVSPPKIKSQIAREAKKEESLAPHRISHILWHPLGRTRSATSSISWKYSKG